MAPQQEIKQLSQIDHVLHRPGMYIGSIVLEPQEEFTLQDDKFKINQRSYIPGLNKVFNEWIDNSIDEFVRTKGKFANKISVRISDKMFEIQDNGRGIPNTKMNTLQGDLKYQATVAFTEMLSGANYDNDDEATIGTNGLGSKAGSIFAKKTHIENDDGKLCLVIDTKNNLKEVQVSEKTSKASGIYVRMYPDLEYFGLETITLDHQSVIKERLNHLSVAYPGITFRFNGKMIKLTQKKYFEMFDAHETMITPEYSIAIGHSTSDNFEHFSLVNGLVAKSGGRHIWQMTGDVVDPMREKLVKKFKTIKPADIRNKMRVVIIMNNFMNAKWDSQTKEELKNSDKEVRDYLMQNVDYTKNIATLVKKVQKNEDIMLGITEYFELKEQAKQNAELKKLKKTKKKIKSEKYLAATENKKVLFLAEGASAVGGLMPSLGRKDYGYFELRGVPLNAYEAKQADFTNNKELSELYQIIQNEDYDYICTATDQDMDGSHIKGLLLGFFKRYLPELLDQNRVGELQTPVMMALKNKKPVRWTYELGTKFPIKAGESGKYFKGLGSWKPDLMKHIVKTDGIESMIKVFDIDDDSILDDWLSGDKVEARKEYLSKNVFDITGA